MLILSIVLMFSLERIMFLQFRLAALIIGFLGVSTFGYGLVYSIMRLRQNHPVFKADSEGLHFNSSLINHGRVDWDNIKEYGLAKYAGRKMILVVLKSPHDFLDNQKGLVRRHQRAKLKRFGTPVAVPAALVPGDPVAVMEQLSAWKNS